MRSLLLAALLFSVSCGDDDNDQTLGSGVIRSLQNIPSSNVASLDGAVDLTGGRDAFVLAAVQNGEANYGQGTVGYSDGRSQLVIGRFDTQFQPLWLATAEGGVGASAPLVATQTLGTAVVAIGDYTGDVTVGGVPRAAPMLAAFSDADGSVRWSVSAAEAVNSHAAAVIVDAQGDVVLARNTDDVPTRVKLDRFTSTGTLVVSRLLGLGTGNARRVSMGYDIDGNLVVLVRFDGTVTLNQSLTAPDGMFYGYVAKVGRDSGTVLWSRPIRLRADEDRVVVSVLSSGDVAVAGPFGFADDTTDTTNPVSTIRYLRTALLANASGTTIWSRRNDLVNAASLTVADASDLSDDLHLSITFNGTLTFGTLTASATTDSAMAVMRLSSADGSPVWLRYSGTSAARGTRVGVLASGDVLGLGTFTPPSGTTSAIFAIQIVP